MKRFILPLLLLLATPAFAQAPQATEAAVQQNWTGLSAALTSLNLAVPNVANALKALLNENAGLRKQVSDAEAQKATLIQWLEAAQGKGHAHPATRAAP